MTVLATDPMAKIDIPYFCSRSGLTVATAETDGELEFRITRPEKA